MNTLTFTEDNLKMLRAVLVCVAKEDEVRYYLRGINISDKYIEGTNGYRIARFEHNHPLNDFADVIIPPFKILASTHQVTLAIGAKETTVTVTAKNGSNTKTILQHIDGRYPNVGSVIPKVTLQNTKHVVVLNSAYLADVQKALGSAGCAVANPDLSGGYLVTYSGFADLIYVVMPLRI